MPFLGAAARAPRAADIQLGLVGMRVREHTIANDQLHQYLSTLNVPVVAWLRDTQNYVQLAARSDAVGRGAEPRRARSRTMGAFGDGCTMKPFAHLQELQTQVGQEIGVSDWVTVDQSGASTSFAEATGDHQWIHVDPVKAARAVRQDHRARLPDP